MGNIFNETRHLVKDLDGKLVPICLEIKVEEDFQANPLDYIQHIEDATERERYLLLFKSGQVFIGKLTIQASALGLSSYEQLNCSLYSSIAPKPNAFERSVWGTILEYAMVDSVIDALVAQIHA